MQEVGDVAGDEDAEERKEQENEGGGLTGRLFGPSPLISLHVRSALFTAFFCMMRLKNEVKCFVSVRYTLICDCE